MTNFTAAISAALAALVVTLAAMTALRPVAFMIDLVDRPGGRKMHSGVVPVVGGLAMLIGVVLGLAVVPSTFGAFSFFVVSATLLVVIGLLDDRFMLSPQMRLLAQFMAVLPMVFGAGISVHTLGDLVGLGSIDTGPIHLFVTALAVMGAINAFNMLDGLDGLAGGVALVALLAMFFLGGHTAGPTQAVLVPALAGAVVGFLCFNAPVRINRRVRCFMGDAGSTLLGFALAWIAIDMTQSQAATIAPVTMVWLVVVPATDLLWSIIRRVANGRSPLIPDSEHLHHDLIRAGFGVRAVFVTMLSIAVLAACTGIALDVASLPEWVSLVLLLATGTGVVVFCRNARHVIRLVPERLRRLEHGHSGEPVDGKRREAAFRVDP